MSNTYQLYGEARSYEDVSEFINHYYQEVRSSKEKHRIWHICKLIDSDTPVKILDYGSGWGVFSRILAEKGSNYNVVGIDRDPESVSIAKEFSSSPNNLSFSASNISDFPAQEFDYVVSMQVIEHVHNPGNYLKHINRVLKDEGELVISLPNVMQPINLLSLLTKSPEKLNKRLIDRSKHILHSYKKEHDHIQAWDPHHFVTLVSSLGFEFQCVKMVEGVPLPKLKYWYTSIFGVRNLSYKMVFSFRKKRFVNISDTD